MASIDRTVKAAETVGAAACGYDSGEKIKGQKRHIATDTLGLVLCMLVTSAAVQDRDGAHSLLARLARELQAGRLTDAGETRRHYRS